MCTVPVMLSRHLNDDERIFKVFNLYLNDIQVNKRISTNAVTTRNVIRISFLNPTRRAYIHSIIVHIIMCA